jgi:hypothetical protein
MMLVPPTLRRHCSSGLGIRRLAVIIYIWTRYPAVVRGLVRMVIFDLSLALMKVGSRSRAMHMFDARFKLGYLS